VDHQVASAENDQDAFAGVQMTDDQIVEIGVARPGNGEGDAVRSELAIRQRTRFLRREVRAKRFAIQTFVPWAQSA
jgi:hypothetical protein